MNTQITEDHVSFEIAKLLKEKGFNESTCGYYHDDYIETLLVSSPSNHNGSINAISAPSLGHAMKWLRKLYCIHFNLKPVLYKGIVIYNVTIYKQAKNHKVLFDGELEVIDYQESSNLTYEQACEEAIKYCLINLI